MISPAEFPPAVRPGDRVGVAALSGPVREDRLQSGLTALRALGYEPVLGSNIRSHAGLFAGSDNERLDGFHALAADADLRAIFFARGGHGLLRILPRIDWSLLAETPRFYVGYSDLTPFLLGVVARLGLVALHGPMIAADLARGLSAEEVASLQAALRADPLPTLPVAGFLAPGSAEGVLLGGCLSLLVSTIGTPYGLDGEGAILAWEDTNEPLYRIDRMLTHLNLSGTLSAVRGMVMGSCPVRGADTAISPDSMPAVECLRDHAASLHGPVAWGLPMGHDSPNWTLPLGRRVLLDSATQELALR
ncbi:MAG: LD-carboxypeptidase [Acidobacteriota bacterium]